tara:strand:- start:380 stop:547 length:168 start_codon:yes stop_codon:yes gene_type:complete
VYGVVDGIVSLEARLIKSDPSHTILLTNGSNVAEEFCELLEVEDALDWGWLPDVD